METVFSYTNYRTFLKEFYSDRKQKNSKFSFRVFARLAQFGSPGYLKMIMDGQRNISHSSIYKLVKAMKLKKRESEYFEKLVLLNQSSDVEEQKELLDYLDSIRRSHPSALLSEYQANLYSKWYNFAVYEMVKLRDFKEDPEWISKKLSRRITPAEAEEAVNRLLEIGLLARTDDGKLVQRERTVAWTGEVANLAVKHYLYSMGQLGLDALNSNESIPREASSLSGLLVSVSKSDLKFVKETLADFRKKLNEKLSREDKTDEVYHLNIQWFPLTNGDSLNQGTGE